MLRPVPLFATTTSESSKRPVNTSTTTGPRARRSTARKLSLPQWHEDHRRVSTVPVPPPVARHVDSPNQPHLRDVEASGGAFTAADVVDEVVPWSGAGAHSPSGRYAAAAAAAGAAPTATGAAAAVGGAGAAAAVDATPSVAWVGELTVDAAPRRRSAPGKSSAVVPLDVAVSGVDAMDDGDGATVEHLRSGRQRRDSNFWKKLRTKFNAIAGCVGVWSRVSLRVLLCGVGRRFRWLWCLPRACVCLRL